MARGIVVTEDTHSGLNLVTGGTGLLGSHFVEQLVRRNRRVRALVRPGSDTRYLESKGVELVEGDMTDAASLRRACEGVSIVYHAAARVGDWGPWQEFVDITIEGTRKILAAAIASNVKRFLHISSISAYGHPNQEGLVIDETAPLGVNLHHWSYYSRAKVEAEKLVWAAHKRGDLCVTVVRPSWLYGPRDRATIGRLCDSILKGKIKLIGDGNNRLNVVHAGNVAEGAIAAAESEIGKGEAFNCSNDGVLTQKQYFNLVAKALGEKEVTRKVPYRVAYTAAYVFEIIGHLLRSRKQPLVTRYSVWLMGRKTFFECQKARKQLGWTPTISYEEGIPDAVADYLKQRNASNSSTIGATKAVAT
ncbi:MAG: NAD-dependent epimerase/dehydratase family protein [Planctomycetes bacterium]|nr:NAD-dependent epimerase/dehydratase family protein [Planctomycetota bacterium]